MINESALTSLLFAMVCFLVAVFLFLEAYLIFHGKYEASLLYHPMREIACNVFGVAC